MNRIGPDEVFSTLLAALDAAGIEWGEPSVSSSSFATNANIIRI
jgi:hypothetical protein